MPHISNSAAERFSNIELARILAMLMIIIGHFVLVFGLWNGNNYISRPDIVNQNLPFLFLFLFGFCIVGVNIFILISGYFSIHLTWKSFLSYYFLCVFYNAAVFLIDTFMFDAFSWKALVKVFLVDKTVNWFFRAYFWLMLLSPLLNKAVENFTIRELRIVVILLAFMNCFSGFILQEFNPNGFNVYNFIFLYILGAWIRKDRWVQNLSKSKAISAYGIVCLLNSLMAVFLLLWTDYPINKVFAYNNPLVLLASVFFFVFFTHLDFSIKAVNVFASTVVATLFIQHIYFMLKPALHFTVTPISAFMIITPLLFLIAFIIEWPRKKVANRIIAYVLTLIPNRQVRDTQET